MLGFKHVRVLNILSYDLVVRALDSHSRNPGFKTLGGSKVNSTVHPSEVDQLSTRNSWELNDKK